VTALDPLAYHAPADALAGRVILVTGAGRGLGRAAASSLARHGATVILHGRNLTALEQVYDEIEAAGGAQPTLLPLDFATATSRDYDVLARAIEDQLGRLDGILHNASHLVALTALENQSLEDWLLQLRVNLAAPAAITRACRHLLRASPDASVLYTGETHALRPSAYWGAFAVAKAGLLTLLRIQAAEWEGTPKLRINLVVPGPVDTPLRRQTHPGESPTARRAPEDLMPAYLYLLGPASRGVSGRVFDLTPSSAP
jgi:NAD(P)-dependent dehydrogenase (short-subunit alcohol dehydrogenase family)